MRSDVATRARLRGVLVPFSCPFIGRYNSSPRALLVGSGPDDGTLAGPAAQRTLRTGRSGSCGRDVRRYPQMTAAAPSNDGPLICLNDLAFAPA